MDSFCHSDKEFSLAKVSIPYLFSQDTETACFQQKEYIIIWYNRNPISGKKMLLEVINDDGTMGKMRTRPSGVYQEQSPLGRNGAGIGRDS